MATLPINRTALLAAQTNQVPNALIRSALNIAAIQEPYDTIDLLNNTMNGLISAATLSRLGVINVNDYNASGLATTAIGSITTGTKALTLTTTPDFVAGQGINLQGAFEVASLQITSPASASANCTVTLNGVAFTVALVSGDTAIQVATKIRAATYTGWTAGGTAGTDTVTFTSLTSGVKTDASYTVGTTGATGTMSTTTQGTADQISTVSNINGLVITIADNSTRTITASAISHYDLTALQSAIDAAFNAGGGVVIVPNGTYMINAVTSLYIKSNVTVILAPNAILKAIAGSAYQYNIVMIKDASNVKFIGGTVQGERTGHIGTTGEEGFGISIIGDCDNILVQSVTVKDCWGDGITVDTNLVTTETSYLIRPRNIIFDKVICDNNRRNGKSIVSGENVKSLNCRYINTNGTAPQAGVDVEPALTQQTNGIYPSNITFENCVFSGNTGDGFDIFHQADYVSLINCVSKNNVGNGFNITASGGAYYATYPSLVNCKAISNTGKGYYFAYANNGRMTNCVSRSNGSYGIYCTNSNEITILSCDIVSNTGLGVLASFASTNINVMGCLLKDNNGSGALTAQLQFTSSGANGVIGGKIINNFFEGAADRGIWLGNANIQNIEISGNNFDGFTGTYKVLNNSAVNCKIDLGFGTAFPRTGYNGVGAFMRNISTALGSYEGWSCFSALVSANVWCGYGQVGVIKGTTANRPVQVYQGYMYRDTTLLAAGKPIWCDTSVVQEVDKITITAAATSSGNVTVTLNGTVTNVAVLAGDTAAAVMNKINTAIDSHGWVGFPNNGGAFVTFYTMADGGPMSAPSYSAGTTGATGTATVVTAGANPTWIDVTGATV